MPKNNVSAYTNCVADSVVRRNFLNENLIVYPKTPYVQLV